MYLEIKITGTNEGFAVDLDGEEKSYGDLLEAIAVGLEKLCPRLPERFKFRLSLDGKKPLEVADDGASAASLGVQRIVYVLAEQQIVDVINGGSLGEIIVDKCDEMSAIDTAGESKEENHRPKSYYERVSLIREVDGVHFPESLIEEFEKSSVSNDFQALLVVIRILMKEEGFTIKDITDQKNSSVKIDFLLSTASCRFVINLIEDSIIIYAIYSTFIRFTVILISSFIRRKPFDCFSLRIYHKLPALSRQFKDTVVLPLMAEMKRDLGIFDHLRLNNLPDIIIMDMMKMLVEKDLLSLASTCSTLNRLANENVLWKRLFELKGLSESLLEETDEDDDWRTKYRKGLAAAAAKRVAEMKERVSERCRWMRRKRYRDRLRERLGFCQAIGQPVPNPFAPPGPPDFFD